MTTLAQYRTRVLNTLKSTNEKFENDTLDESIRRVLDEYSQSFPDVRSHTFALTQSGRAQLLVDCTGLLSVTQIVLPHDLSLLDPSFNAREDFYVFFCQGSPYVYFTGMPIPLRDQALFVRYTCRHTLSGLDGAEVTTVRPDHESMLIVGAAGAAATSRAAGTIEQWGGKSGDPNQLMLWGQAQYRKFRDFLLTIRTDQGQAVFSNSSWPLDGKDGSNAW